MRTRLAIFVDGCFWHWCPLHAVLPKANREFWEAKLAANRVRDQTTDRALARLGWSALHVWEHEDPEQVAESLAALWKGAVTPSELLAAADAAASQGALMTGRSRGGADC